MSHLYSTDLKFEESKLNPAFYLRNHFFLFCQCTILTRQRVLELGRVQVWI